MKTIRQIRPAGVFAVAWLFFAAAAACVITAALTATGSWPLAWGRYIVGDFVTMGPVVFVVAALVYAGIGWRMLRLQNWARRLAIVVAAVGLYLLIPTISSSVADLRIGAIVVDGSQIIIRVLVMWYLMQQDVADAFLAIGD